VVAGAPVVLEKKRWGYVLDFIWRIDATEAGQVEPDVFDVISCAA